MSQAALFPMDVMNVTQRYGSGTSTHKNAFAIDIAGADSGISQAHAPFDCKVVHRYAPNDWNLGHTVWFESLAPVKYSDGTEDYAVVSMTHDNDVSDLPVGKTFSQGQKIYDEGTAGRATGNHIHLECGRGKFSGTGWRQVGTEWVINNAYKPEHMLALFNTKIVNDGGLYWKSFKEVEMPITKEQENTLSFLATGDYPGKGYDYRYTGQPATPEVLNQLLNFWLEVKNQYHKSESITREDAIKYVTENLK